MPLRRVRVLRPAEPVAVLGLLLDALRELPAVDEYNEDLQLDKLTLSISVHRAAAPERVEVTARGRASWPSTRNCRAWLPTRRPVAILNRIHWHGAECAGLATRARSCFVVASGGRAVAETLTRGVFFL